MSESRFHKFIDKNSDILVITVQCFHTLGIVKNNHKIDDNLIAPCFCMEKSLSDYNYDTLFLRDVYDIYYLAGININNKDNTYHDFINIIKENIRKEYRKIIMIGSSAGATAILLFILNSDLSEMTHECYICSPQTNIFDKSNVYLHKNSDKSKKARTDILQNHIIPFRYNNDFAQFNLIPKLNNYAGQCVLNLYAHDKDAYDKKYLDGITNPNIKIHIMTNVTKETHNTLQLVYKQILDDLSK